jgi:aminoglycoside 6'-N-acetyltransferase
LKLRPAAIEDLPLLKRWDSQPHVIAATGDNDFFDWETELPRSVDWRELLIAELDGRPIGFVQIIDPAREETHYWGDAEENLRAIDIWIGEAADLGKGYGTQMMRLALERCFSDQAVTAVLIDPLLSNVCAPLLRADRLPSGRAPQVRERRLYGLSDRSTVTRSQ